MKKLLLFLLTTLAISSHLLKAQEAVDSLKLVLQSKNLKNKGKVSTYNELAWELRIIDLDTAYLYADSAELLANKINYLKGLGDAHQRKGTIFKLQGSLDGAYVAFREALKVRKELKDSSGMAASYKSLGGICRTQGRFNQAAEYLYESLSIRESLKELNKLYSVQKSLLNLYSDMQDSLKVQEYFNESKATVTKQDQASLFLEYAIIYLNNGWSIDTVKTYFSLAENLGGLKRNQKHKIPLIKAKILIKSNQLQEAKLIIDSFIESTTISNNIKLKIAAYEVLTEIFIQLEDYKAATKSTNQALLLAQQAGDIGSILNQYRRLSIIYANIKNYKLAYEFSTSYYNGLENAPKENSVSKTEQTYLIKKDNEAIRQEMESVNEILKLQSEKAKAQKNAYLVLFISAIIIAIAIFFILQQRAKNLKALNEKNQELMASKEKEHNNRIEQVLTEKEVEMLEAVMNGMEKERTRIGQDLHDELGSILATTRLHFASMEDQIDQLNDTQQQQYKKGIALIDQACDEMRNISHNMMSGLLQEYGLVIAIKDLAQSINDAGMITVNVIDSNLETRLPQETEVVIYRIIQELLSNILKHAQASEVTIQINRYNGDLGITVEDDGRGFDYHVSRQGNGMGLRNIERRVSALGGTWHVETSPGRGTLSNITVHI